MVTNNNDGIVFTIFGRRGKEEGERGGEERDATTRKKKRKNEYAPGEGHVSSCGVGTEFMFLSKT
jgi:hypothetical protein